MKKIVLLCMFVFVFGCATKGDEGPQGPTGPSGTDGATGPVGMSSGAKFVDANGTSVLLTTLSVDYVPNGIASPPPTAAAIPTVADAGGVLWRMRGAAVLGSNTTGSVIASIFSARMELYTVSNCSDAPRLVPTMLANTTFTVSWDPNPTNPTIHVMPTMYATAMTSVVAYRTDGGACTLWSGTPLSPFPTVLESDTVPSTAVTPPMVVLPLQLVL